jgi:hypothetical protein
MEAMTTRSKEPETDYRAIAEGMAVDAYPGLRAPINHNEHEDPRLAYIYCAQRLLPLLDRLRKGHNNWCRVHMIDKCTCGLQEALDATNELFDNP